jgi:apolipoprotein D and lipocalin family protein
MEMIKVFAIVIGLMLGASQSAKADELQTVASVDLNKYLGIWYEIARFPNSFQKDCVAVKAEYSKLSNGKIQVVNSCRKKSFDGKLTVAKGKAKVVDTVSNSKLKVTFFWPFYGDYWIILLDTDYEWAVVSEPNRDNLWILSRNTTLETTLLEDIKHELVDAGFDLSKLSMTPQPASPY